MSWNAAQACARRNIPRLIYTRRPWEPAPQDRWTRVADIEAAVAALGREPLHVFLTVGRLSLPAFARSDESAKPKMMHVRPGATTPTLTTLFVLEIRRQALVYRFLAQPAPRTWRRWRRNSLRTGIQS
jgi:precorrin-6x reductase